MLEDFKLKVFLSVAEKGSFTQAARSLGISQPAVSQNIAELERLTGTQLFARNRGSATLTAAGTAFKEYADKISYWYSAAGRMFGPEGKLTAAHPVTIAADDFISGSTVPKLLAKILAAKPSSSFRIVSPGSGESEADIRLSCKASTGELSFEENATYLTSVPAMAVGSSQAYSETRDLRQLPERTSLAVHRAYSKMLPADLVARVSVVADSAAVVSLALRSPDIVAVLPSSAVPEGLVRLPVLLPELSMDIHLEACPDPAAQAIAERIRSLAAEDKQ